MTVYAKLLYCMSNYIISLSVIIGMVSRVDDILRMDLADDDGDIVELNENKYNMINPYQQYPSNEGMTPPTPFEGGRSRGGRSVANSSSSSGIANDDSLQNSADNRRKMKKSVSRDEDSYRERGSTGGAREGDRGTSSRREKSQGAVRLEEGSKVEADYRGRGKWYAGRITRDRGDGTYDIVYDDGESEARVQEAMIRVTKSNGSGRDKDRESSSSSNGRNRSYDQDESLAFTSSVNSRTRKDGMNRKSTDRESDRVTISDIQDEDFGGIASSMNKMNMYDLGNNSSGGKQRK